MKTCLLFPLAFLLHFISYAQVQVDRDAEKKYREAVKKVPEEFLTVFQTDTVSNASRNLLRRLFSFGIYTMYRIDTLNKKDAIPHSGTVVIHDIDPVTGRSYPMPEPKKHAYSDGEYTYLPIISTATFENDAVKVGMPFLFEPRIEWDLTSNNIFALYKDYRKKDFIFRTDTLNPKTDAISLPMQIIRFTVSDTALAAGKIIYGETEMKTPVFYEDTYGLTGGYIRKQLHIVCVFELRIKRREDFNQ